MEIKINSELYRELFAVPSIVAEQHLKLASHAQLKVLLFVAKYGSDTLDHTKLDISETECKEAVLYWQQAGVFQTQATAATNASKSETTRAISRKPSKPDRIQVAQRATESKEIAVLMRQAEVKFGRTLRQNEASTLVYLIDDEGMKPSVLLMLMDYAIRQGRATLSYIESMAVDWISKGINNASRAEKEIMRLDIVRSAWGLVARCFGIGDRRPSKKEEELAYKWVEEYEYSEPMLRLAYDKCVDATGKMTFPYISKIVDGWHKNGYHTPQDVENGQEKADGKKSTSYDMDVFEQMINGD